MILCISYAEQLWIWLKPYLFQWQVRVNYQVTISTTKEFKFHVSCPSIHIVTKISQSPMKVSLSWIPGTYKIQIITLLIVGLLKTILYGDSCIHQSKTCAQQTVKIASDQPEVPIPIS